MNSTVVKVSLIGLVGVVLVLAYLSLYRVHVTQQAIILQFGNYIETVQEPGLHFKLPWRTTIYMDRRILSLDLPPQEVIASDEKRLVVDALVRFKISDPLEFFKTVQGSETIARQRLATTVVSNLRRVLGNQEFSTLLTEKRAELMNRIRDRVHDEVQTYGVDIIDVRIKRADLPANVSAQVFNRMQTQYKEQAAERRATGREEADRIRGDADRQVSVILADARRDAEIIRGEGDSQAVRIFAEAFGQDADFFEFYRSMQAYRATVGKDNTTMVLSPDSEFFKYLNQFDGGRR